MDFHTSIPSLFLGKLIAGYMLFDIFIVQLHAWLQKIKEEKVIVIQSQKVDRPQRLTLQIKGEFKFNRLVKLCSKTDVKHM